MKNKILTAISTIMLFVPWTILPLRTFDWALESPVAEIMVYSYAACFAAVTLRLWLPFLIAVFHDFETAYVIVAWLCWVPNLIVANYLTKRYEASRAI